MTTSEFNLTKFIEYREKSATQATKLFTQLLPGNDSFLHEAKHITILVIAAGTFPGYVPLLQRLASIAPQLQHIHIAMVEPVKKFTDFFIQHFSSVPPELQHIQVSFEIANQGVEEFLKHCDGVLFDLVYFEHPETMTLPIVFAKLGLRNFKRVISLRKSLPGLAKVLPPNALIVASCMSKHELKQLKSLLQFSLDVRPKMSASHNPLHYFFGGPFCAGLHAAMNKIILVDELQKQKESVIDRSDSFLFIFVLLSVAIYLWKFSIAGDVFVRTLAVVLIGAQLLLHRPGKVGLLIKVVLLCLLFSLTSMLH